MKRNLVVTSSTTVRLVEGVELDAAVELACAGERRRLEAYLYSSATLVAVVHEVEASYGTDKRVTQRALVTVQGNDGPEARHLADYQGGRLQSGSFGVMDYVEDEYAAREHVGIADAPEEPLDLRAALLEAADLLSLEEVEYSLGLNRDHLEHSYVTENGVDRPRTQDDLDADLARHARLINALRVAAEILNNA